MSSYSKLALVAVAAGTVGIWFGSPSERVTREQRELSARTSLAQKVAECERRGFQADSATGDCLNIPMPAGMR